MNPLYEPNNAVIWPSVAAQSLVGIIIIYSTEIVVVAIFFLHLCD